MSNSLHSFPGPSINSPSTSIDEHAVAVVDEVTKRLNGLRSRLPAGYTLEIVRDQSDFIKDSVESVQEHLVMGAILAALVVLLFLRNWRSTLIAAIAIPASIVSTFALMYAMGFTLNILTLLALTLAVGIVIDDAIVVLENIVRFIEEKGYSPKGAAVVATKEIGLAVLATSLSLVAVFLPIVHGRHHRPLHVELRLHDELRDLRVARRELHADADALLWARLQQEPLRARAILRWIAIILLILLVWAAFAKVDEVTRGEGKVIPSRQLQIIQAVDGGVISDLLVREGQIVEAGQLLLKIDATRFESSLQENRSQYLTLLAKAARLRAIAEGRAFIVPPEVEKEAPQLAMQERSLYDARRSELDAQIGIARQQLSQRNHELSEIRVRRDQAAMSYDLTNQELKATKPLVSSHSSGDSGNICQKHGCRTPGAWRTGIYVQLDDPVGIVSGAVSRLSRLHQI